MANHDHTLRITLPLPPSSNHIYVRRSKVYYQGKKRKKRVMNVLSKRACQWMQDAKDEALKCMEQEGWVCREDKKMVIELVVWWPDRRRRDAHNLLKLLCDALEGIVVNDDKWMLVRVMDFDYDKGHSRVEVKAYDF